jgi:hypothetical protein
VTNLQQEDYMTLTNKLPHEAKLALEWLLASGSRTETRLRELVAHFCTTNAINADTQKVIADAAHRHALDYIDDYRR